MNEFYRPPRPPRSFDHDSFHTARREAREKQARGEMIFLLLAAIACAILIILAGCGNHTKVERHEVSRETLDAVSGRTGLYGYARWKDQEYVVYCDIYYLAPEAYPSRACYDAVVRHEVRHCYEFHFHGNGPMDGIEPECTPAQPMEGDTPWAM
jgi:hypothetical protein